MLQTRSMQMLEMGMDAAVVRRGVIANNVANVDVPNFKRSEVAFEANLQRAIDSERAAREKPLLQTRNPAHVAGRPAIDYRTVSPQIHTDYLSEMRNDGNNVDIEQEMTGLVRNQMHYNLMADRMAAQYRRLNFLMRLA